MKAWKWILGLLVVYMVGFLVFVASLPRPQGAPKRAQGIVALTGGDERVTAAVNLLEAGEGSRLLISGVHPSTTKSEIKRLAHGGPRFECCADLGYAAADTRGNAQEAAAWARAHRFRSLIVVTASYHMPRSLRLFHAAMPKVRLIAYPVEPAGIDLTQWWHPGTLHLLHNEYLKYVASLVMTAVDHRSAGGKA